MVGGHGAIFDVDHQPGFVEMTVRTSSAAVIVVAQRWHPDWMALYDGQPAEIIRIDGLLIGVLVPAGEGRLAVSYASESTRVGATSSGSSLAIVVLLLLLGWSRRRRTTADLPS